MSGWPGPRHTAGNCVDSGHEGRHLPLAVLLRVVLHVALRVVAVLLLRYHAVGVNAEFLKSALQLVILLS